MERAGGRNLSLAIDYNAGAIIPVWAVCKGGSRVDKKEITLTVDSGLAQFAEEEARAFGLSMSDFVEDVLHQTARYGRPSRLEGGLGKGATDAMMQEVAKDDPRLDYLMRKYMR